MILKNAIVRLLENKITYFLSLLIFIVAFMSVEMRVFATEVDIDSERFDSTIVEHESYGEFDTTNLLRLRENCYYDEQSELFYLGVDGYPANAVISNVLNGMYVQEEVKINVIDGLHYRLYRDGSELTDYNGGILVEPGSYSLMVDTNQGNNVSVLAFTILGKYSNSVKFTLPDTCYLSSVTMNGEDMRHNASYLDFVSEGRYLISYDIDGTNKHYKLDVTIDTIAPTIELKGVDEKGNAKGEVEILGLEDDVNIDITLDEQKIAYSKTLGIPGEYTIVLSDEAGNSNVYNFTILFHINVNSVLFIIMFIALIVAIVVYASYIRSHLRVR